MANMESEREATECAQLEQLRALLDVTLYIGCSASSTKSRRAKLQERLEALIVVCDISLHGYKPGCFADVYTVLSIATDWEDPIHIGHMIESLETLLAVVGLTSGEVNMLRARLGPHHILVKNSVASSQRSRSQ